MKIKIIEGNNTKQKSVNKRMRTPDNINKLKHSSISILIAKTTFS